MSWKGSMRSLQAAQRRSERDALKKQNELKRQQKQLEKMQETERARYEVQVYENYIDVLLSVHKESGNQWEWESIHSSEVSDKPTKNNRLELEAQAQLDNYKPSRSDKLFKRTESKIEELTKAITEAQKIEDEQHQEALKYHENEVEEWTEITELAGRILANEPEAHLEAIERLDPFSEINQLGSSINFKFDGDLIEVTLHVNGEEIIPAESKTLLKSGKLSTKKMPKSKFYEIYQDYVCGAVLRVARELFSLLPIDVVIVTATGTLLNTKSGHMEDQPILSVAIPRKTIDSLNIEMIDPSDSMANFVHRMNFKKTKGFSIIQPILPQELESNQTQSNN